MCLPSPGGGGSTRLKGAAGGGDSLSPRTLPVLRDRHPTPSRILRCEPTLPLQAGLSHVAEEVEKEGVVPAGTFDFLAHGYAVWMRANDIDCESSQDREVLGAIVFSGSVGVLG